MWAVAAPVWAATYYVATDGDDARTSVQAQNIATPWLTIQKATTAMVAGDITYVRGGTYTENTITFGASGTRDNPVTLKAYPGESPIIDSGFSYPTDATRKAAIWINFGRSWITIEGFEIKNTKGSGIHVGEDTPMTEGIVIQRNHIHDVLLNTPAGNTAAIYVGPYAGDLRIRYNTLHPETQATTRGSGIEIFSGANNHLIEYNNIYHAVKGIYFKHGVDIDTPYATNHVVVRYNYIHDISTVGGSTDGIEVATDNAELIGNVIVDVSGGNGIRLYEVSSTCDKVGTFYTIVDHNTIIRSATSAIVAQQPSLSECSDRGAKHSRITNNLIYKTATTSLANLTIWPSGTIANGIHDTTSDYNLVYSTDSSAVWRLYASTYTSVGAWNTATASDTGFNSTAADTHSLQSAPTFMGYASGDFRLTAASAGYNAGSDGVSMGACLMPNGARAICVAASSRPAATAMPTMAEALRIENRIR